MKKSASAQLESLRIMVQTMITLASASLGLVAALAWNEAIKDTIKQVLGEQAGLKGEYVYAIAATTIAVVVLTILGRIAAKIGGKAAIEREAEG